MIEERKKLKATGVVLTSIPDTIPESPTPDKTAPTQSASAATVTKETTKTTKKV